jgi:carbamoyl-phosphate synthase large subunit
MGVDRTFGLAFGKAQISAGDRLPDAGMVFLSLADRDKAAGLKAAARFVELGFSIAATHGTAEHLERHDVPVAQRVAKVASAEDPTAGAGDPPAVDGDGRPLPTAVDLIGEGKVSLVVNSPRGRGARADGAYIRRAANVHRVPCLTTASAAVAAAESTLDRTRHHLRVRTLQEIHRR